jgi:lipoprotein-anchoring transpeptidase ErfK/SrfK
LWVPALRSTAEEALHRVRDTWPRSGVHSRDRQVSVAPCGLFPGECCFPGIYFARSIFFLLLALDALAQTCCEVERSMSLRIAVALAATLGAGMLMSTGAEARPDIVGFRGDYSPGTIVVKTNERRLYLVLDQEHAVRYPVGVGKAGKQWAGITQIDGKYRQPAWSPPADVKRDKPTIPDVIPGGSPQNPMGVAAMTLAGGEYAIHGTNVPGSVGGFVSYGCIRMLNDDITDLYQRVSVGTTVVVSH